MVSITINLFLPMIDDFGKCQNLGESDEMYH